MDAGKAGPAELLRGLRILDDLADCIGERIHIPRRHVQAGLAVDDGVDQPSHSGGPRAGVMCGGSVSTPMCSSIWRMPAP